jgi:hypothetical protein
MDEILTDEQLFNYAGFILGEKTIYYYIEGFEFIVFYYKGICYKLENFSTTILNNKKEIFKYFYSYIFKISQNYNPRIETYNIEKRINDKKEFKIDEKEYKYVDDENIFEDNKKITLEKYLSIFVNEDLYNFLYR